MICVASGKGGVGKSTMTANLAAALVAEGHKAGALDCDVYGYSIPRMLGINQKPEVSPERKIIPPVSPSGATVMSIGFFVEENAAVVWRGPMLHKAIQQFLEDVAWDELDYLLLDLPPGTGDVSMTLAQLLPQAKIVIVTTPQPAAQSVARRSAEMAAKVDLEVLGVIENMSAFNGPDGERVAIFGEGGGQMLADELDVPLLAKVPLSTELREHADNGKPLVIEDPDAPASQMIVKPRAASSPRRRSSSPCFRARKRYPQPRRMAAGSAAQSCRWSSSGGVAAPLAGDRRGPRLRATYRRLRPHHRGLVLDPDQRLRAPGAGDQGR